MANLLPELEQTRKPVNLLAELQQQQTDPTIGQQIVGGLENIGSLVTGAVAEPVAGIAGIAQGLNPFAEEGAAAQAVEDVRGALTFQPSTQAGQSQQQAIGEALAPVVEALKSAETTLGEGAFDLTGSPSVAAAATALPTAVLEAIGVAAGVKGAKRIASAKAKRKLLADEIRKGTPNIDNVTKALNDSGEIVTNKAAKKAVNILGGDVKAQQTVSVLENLNPASKKQVNKMLDLIEKGRKEPIFGQTNRPSDVLGDSVANRAKAISKLNSKAKADIGDASKSLKGTEIDISTARDRFFNDMQDLGVEFKDVDGRIKPDFSNSSFVGGGSDKIERIANAVKSGSIDGLSAHRQKQFIRDLVSFGKGTDSAVSARSEGVLKRLASGIDAELDSLSPKYKKANENFAKTIELTEKLNKLAGKDVDIFSDLSSKSLGSKARRLVSNAESRVDIEQTLLDADNTLKEFGVRFKDDIPSLSHTVTQFENIFKIEPPGSFQGRIQRAGANIAQGVSPTGALTDAAIGKIFKLSEPDFNKKMKALRLLTKQGN